MSAIATRYEVVVGLEVHAQVLTQSKMFCGCSTDYLTTPPNANTCPVCLGLPGSLPVINRRAVEATLRTALALNCEIPEFSKFDRKNYFYPDLPKGYQISQYDLPFSRHGLLEFDVKGEARRCGITRVHLEEDTGKLLHAGAIEEAQSSLIDFNRAGVPLMEIVSEPDLRSADEAREYVMRLRAILQYIGVNHGDMESGQLRVDANVSLRPVGTTEYGTKVEIKNMNSFRAIHRAIEYEIGRQTEVLESGGRLVQETRGWNDARGLTVSQRTKEFAEDYRYFPEPDLPPLEVSRDWVAEIRSSLPELPAARRERFIKDFGLSKYDASLLTSSKAVADYYESVVTREGGAPAKLTANWILGDLAGLRTIADWDKQGAPMPDRHLRQLVKLIDSGAISGKMAKEVLTEVVSSGKSPLEIRDERGLSQLTDDQQLNLLIDQVLTDPGSIQSIKDYRAGKERALAFLMGQAMKFSKGRANPQQVTDLLKERLGGTAAPVEQQPAGRERFRPLPVDFPDLRVFELRWPDANIVLLPDRVGSSGTKTWASFRPAAQEVKQSLELKGLHVAFAVEPGISPSVYVEHDATWVLPIILSLPIGTVSAAAGNIISELIMRSAGNRTVIYREAILTAAGKLSVREIEGPADEVAKLVREPSAKSKQQD